MFVKRLITGSGGTAAIIDAGVYFLPVVALNCAGGDVMSARQPRPRQPAEDKYSGWNAIIKSICTELQVLALVVLVIEATYAYAINTVTDSYRLTVILSDFILLLCLVAGLLYVIDKRASRSHQQYTAGLPTVACGPPPLAGRQ